MKIVHSATLILSGFYIGTLLYYCYILFMYLQAACAETYGAESLYEFQSSFFNCIKKEVQEIG